MWPFDVTILSLLLVMETDPNVEPMHWLEVVQLKRTVYSRAFVLSPGAER